MHLTDFAAVQHVRSSIDQNLAFLEFILSSQFFNAHTPCQLHVPDWPAPPGVQARMTGRQAFDCPLDLVDGRASFNLGAHVGDALPDVQQRRRQLDEAFGTSTLYLNQVHGTRVQHLSRQIEPGTTPEADACCTLESGLACAIMVADCLPVLACNRAGTWVGAAHAGWRGLAGGVLEALIEAHRRDCPEAPGVAELMFWLGPCIGPTAFEVGDEVKAAFEQAGSGSVLSCFEAAGSGKWLANLSALARGRLLRQGVRAVYGNDGSHPWCTVRNPEHWFSYRRDQVRLGCSGRMAAFIWRE